jgi:serine/threonine-protein phosphatase 2A catalytic subunit
VHGQLDAQIEQLTQCKPLPEQEVQSLCEKAKEILMQENNVQVVPLCPLLPFGNLFCCCHLSPFLCRVIF